jgi:hypothetical protein
MIITLGVSINDSNQADIMLLTLFIFLQLVHQPTYALNKIQFMTSIKLLHVSALGYHPQGVF